MSVPKIVHNESVSSLNDNDFSEKLESISEHSPKVPINVTITDKKCKDPQLYNILTETLDHHEHQSRESTTEIEGIKDDRNNVHSDNNAENSPGSTMNNTVEKIDTVCNPTGPLNKSESLIKFDDSVLLDTQTNQNENIIKQNSINSSELSVENNVQSKKPVNTGNNLGKTIYFDEIIVGGERKNVSTINRAESFLESLPAINQKANSIFGDLPPLNGKKANINDLKELMDIGLGEFYTIMYIDSKNNLPKYY